jgi:TRAP-type mannitol/chloroaromatic compound transport system substrate-binding protein
MRFMKSASLAVSAAVLALVLANAPARADEPSFALTLKDHKFSPGLTIPADTKVKITVKNEDATVAEFESDDFQAEKVVQPGAEVSFYVGPLKAGTYEFHDEYHEDESKTTLTVK